VIFGWFYEGETKAVIEEGEIKVVIDEGEIKVVIDEGEKFLETTLLT
jgi:hypothetical protein